MTEPSSISEVGLWILRHPTEAFIRRWNYKSALLSSVVRASLFFVTNASAGMDAAVAAMLTELTFRFCTSGFYGALTQAFRKARPEWAATLCAMVLLPVVSHGLELLVHWVRGTPELLVSIAASAAFTVVSTAFNLFAMRNGVLIVGADGRSILEDLRRMPRVAALFVMSLARACRACL